MIAVLDNIRSVHNVGSIFRTSDALGVKKIILCGFTPCPINELGILRNDFRKTSLGAEQNVDWKKNNSVIKAVKDLKGKGYKIIAAEVPSGKNYTELKVSKRSLNKTAVIFGNELEGINPKAVKLSDAAIQIPMSGIKESLNVSVAFGIIVSFFNYLSDK